MSEDEFLYANDLVSITSLINARLDYIGASKKANDHPTDQSGTTTTDFGTVAGIDFL